MEHIYTLTKPVEYAHKGDVREAQFISMKEPSARNISAIAPIKQALTVGIEHAQSRYSDDDVSKDDAEGEIDGKSLISIIESSGSDMESIVLHFQQLFNKSGLFLVDGEEKMTMPIIDSLSIDDFYGLAGDFLKNFIIPFLMNGKKN